MKNWEVAAILKRIAALLALKEENDYKASAYHRAARVILELPVAVEKMVQEDRLKELRGIGSVLDARIKEIVLTGTSSLLEELETEIPEELLALSAFPGIGPKRARLLYLKLKPDSLADIENAVYAGKVRQIPGMGTVVEKSILKGLEQYRTQPLNLSLSTANFAAKRITAAIENFAGTKACFTAGALRRGEESLNKVELIICYLYPAFFIDKILKMPFVREIITQTKNFLRFKTLYGLDVCLYITDKKKVLPALWLAYTGTCRHLSRLKKIAESKKLFLAPDGLYSTDGKPISIENEEGIYKHLGLPFVPPEIRYDQGEIEAASAGKLPALVEHELIKGDLHLHSNWSDGRNSICELAQEALQRGYSYIAITDHSRSLSIARGLTVKKIKEQIDFIDRLADEIKGIQIFKGIEVDILKNGELDLPDSILKELDIVIASIHSGFNQSEEEIMHRLFTAMNNPYVSIIGHPTGRLLTRRSGYAIDIEKFLQKAKETNTVVEINASPDRLDLGSEYVRKGKEIGVVFAINTDAHSTQGMVDLQFGVTVARRGWLEKNNIINTLPLEKMCQFVRTEKANRG
ncbi:MAG: DNA polymerase/3'-5' exonuclease PolX [Firmicutes bacterium]|nr:DNA polymerase/3'-5' exonuclease PolX [Bacillota bacterium]